MKENQISQNQRLVFLLDNYGKIEQVSEDTKKILGYDTDKIIGCGFLEIIRNEEEDAYNSFSHLKELVTTQEHQIKLISSNERLIDCEVDLIPNFDKSENCSGYTLIAELKDKENQRDKYIDNIKTIFHIIEDQEFLSLAILQDNVFKYVNKNFLKVTGYTRKEVKNWGPGGFLKVIDPEYRDFVREQAKKKQMGDPSAVFNYFFKGLKKSGKSYWAEVYSKTIEYNGKPADLVITLEITEKMMIEKTLQETQQRYRSLFENAPYYIIIIDMTRRIIDCNSMTEKLLGYSKDEMIGKALSDFDMIDEKKGRELAQRAMLMLKGAKAPRVELQVKRKDGKLIWVQSHSSFFKVSGETYIQIYGADITDKKDAERLLKESEEKFRTLAEQSLIGMNITSRARVLYSNNATAEIYGYNRSEIKDWAELDFLNIIHPEDKPDILEAIKRQVKSEKELVRFHCRIITKQKTIKWIEMISKPIKYKDKDAVFTMIVDITDKKKAEEELRRLDQIKSDLLKRTSHELKTPLVSIKGFSSLLTEMYRDKLDDEIMEIIQEIKSGCNRLESLIKDILKTAELDSEDISINKDRKNLSLIIKEVVKELEGYIKERNHDVIIDVSENLMIMLEKKSIKEVVGNILTNALKYTPPNGKIFITSMEDNKKVKISIKDNGIGLTKEEQTQLFKQFGKIEKYGLGYEIDSDGTGLGLFISKKIIELHNGSIGVHSKGKNQGSTFYFTLPKS